MEGNPIDNSIMLEFTTLIINRRMAMSHETRIAVIVALATAVAFVIAVALS